MVSARYLTRQTALYLLRYCTAFHTAERTEEGEKTDRWGMSRTLKQRHTGGTGGEREMEMDISLDRDDRDQEGN